MWRTVCSWLAMFFLFYVLTIELGAAFYHSTDKMSWGDAVLYSIDSITARGRIPEPANFSVLGRFVSGAEAIIGHLAPSFVFGLIFAVAGSFDDEF